MYILKTLLDGRASVSSYGVSFEEDKRFNDCVRDFCEGIQQKQMSDNGSSDYSIHIEDSVQVVINQKNAVAEKVHQDSKSVTTSSKNKNIYSNLPSKVLNYAELLYCDQAEEIDINGNFFAQSLGFWMLGNNGIWIGISEHDGKLALGQIRECDIIEVLQSISTTPALLA
ncbi:MAG: hypothetical protein LBC50_02290 [Candidatus Ancillula sp.]|jgi:hypothetical protein|nr:hypothetical protein [Candidatus Ancillula sp.]